jgi:hypothetical protein
MQIELYGDPACSWSQVAVQWLDAVGEAKGFGVAIRPYSLLLRDEGSELTEQQVARRTASLRVLRVLAAMSDEQGLALWSQVTADYGRGLLDDLGPHLRGAGIDEGLDWLADEKGQDDVVRGWMAIADALAGPSPRLPVIVLDGAVGFSGPLLRALPPVKESVALWEAMLALARTPGFYGLSRPHPGHPHAPFAPTPEPPSL